MKDLAQQQCAPCQSGAAPLKGGALTDLQRQLAGGWKVLDEHHLEREYKFPDFRKALAFVNQIGELAESQNHHPDVFLAWGEVKLTLWTHSVGGLSENDFIFAAKADKLRPG